MLVSLFTHDAADPSLNHVVKGAYSVQNRAGLFGAYLSGILVDFLGFAAYVPAVLLGVMGARRVLSSQEWPWWRWFGFFIMLFCLGSAGAAFGIGIGPVRGGGLLGGAVHDFSIHYFNPTGSALIWVFAFFLAVQLLCGLSWVGALLLPALEGMRRLGDLPGKIKEGRQEREKRKALEIDSGAKPAAARSKRLPGQTEKSGGVADSGLFLSPAPSASLAAPQPAQTVVKNPPKTREEQPVQEPPAVIPPAPALSFTLSLAKRDKPEEEEVPPWLLDLEADRLGAPARAEAAAPAQSRPAPSASVPVKTAAPQPVAVPEPAAPIKADPPKPAPMIQMEKVNLSKPALPPLDLLHSIAGSGPGTPIAVLEEKGRNLMTCLNDFGIQGELVGITPGPVVTMFEVRPAPGVKVSRIAGLSDDLALSLKAVAVRIQAPIPGTDTVGIEIPNDVRELVCLKEVFSSSAFGQAESLLTMALGKDISGNPAVADLARMPHLLVAGATGAGKSVCLNSILLSFLYKAGPEDVKLLLVDPKRIEMAVYADLPHLVHPVVTEMALAKNALDWAVREMDRRYTDIARLGVRNVAAFNEKLAALGKARPPDLADLEPMPYLVIVIDELADLMLTAAKEVETSIVRLAQLARAAGIHLIIATQRPSVDVVTGLIKANFPCRIAFQVTSKHDSRTILDTVGAEHLLGKGDMLFKPAGGRFQRMHGAFVRDDDVSAVVKYWRSQQAPVYKVDFAEPEESDDFDGPAGGAGGGDIVSDPMYTEAVDFVRGQGKASISLIQRRFRIGFNRAARFVEQMEQDGIIGPADGSKPRLVVR